MKQLFLPAGLILAVPFALFLREPDILLAENNGSKILVFIIFLVSGYQTGTGGISPDRRLLVICLAAAFVSLLLSPVLGVITAGLFSLPQYLAMGMIIVAAVPPTYTVIRCCNHRNKPWEHGPGTVSDCVSEHPRHFHHALHAGSVPQGRRVCRHRPASPAGKAALFCPAPLCNREICQDHQPEIQGFTELELRQLQLHHPGSLQLFSRFQKRIC